MANLNVRNSKDHNAQQERMTRDTLIMQKVNGAHREAFKTRFPGQVEHCMRLTAERLQAVLTTKPKDLTDPGTWETSPEDIWHLTKALKCLTDIQTEHPVEKNSNDPRRNKNAI